MSDQMVEPLAWDTAFWGVPSARVCVTSSEQLGVATEKCLQAGIRWASLLVPSENLELVGDAVRDGYSIVDVRYTMATRLPAASSVDASLARADDIDALAAIAQRALVSSRFYADPHLDDARCAQFYETWLRNSFNGPMADAIVVARGPTGVDGFITVRSPRNGQATLPLVAIHPERQGQGIGRRLLTSALSWIAARGAHRAEVVTQLSNVGAIALYGTAGFRLESSAVWLHRWFDESETT